MFGLLQYYQHHHIKCRLDRKGSLMEDEITTPLQTIQLYYTQNKLLTQVPPSVIKTWLSDEFVFEQTAQMITYEKQLNTPTVINMLIFVKLF